MNQCHVCQSKLDEPIYVSPNPISLTSLCQVYPQKTEVFFCDNCGHLQTKSIDKIDEYYDQNYQILIDTEEEDQLYKIIDGKKIFRVDHQVNVLLDKLTLPPATKVLDYGCAKAATLKKLSQIRTDLIPHVFDVSQMYIPFWDKFILPENCATYSLKSDWNQSFDLITSFFALEHTEEPQLMLSNIFNLLKDDGYFYCIIPNTYTNIADFIVLDHVNHFSVMSLQYLLNITGFEIVEIDQKNHDSAFVIVARKPTDVKLNSLEKNTELLKEIKSQVNNMVKYWQNIVNQVRDFEKNIVGDAEAVIYGSGFYGSFIATCLSDINKIKYFLDQNPFQQGKTLFGKPIIAPQDLPDNFEYIYVGLNPQNAQKIITEIDFWINKNHQYLYL
ncbi:class I SAM-dependent methyltransferase [Geminocystis sp. GBBB08]|uniref:class I SAM-dependent methyltransferase n=1 Tax=Geminocystis sp. GBBB08 TaxID=2604140 RepID=UPI0027E24553|nr:class I SAM-dependent methyltransferase [Geminocystis sp. GBBB08]MBL1210716.1 class I SAM-dependent methyltransferase [Geminocystis sp. GBBB08]